MIQQGWKRQQEPRRDELELVVKRVSTGSGQKNSFLDSMLGSGSTRVVSEAAGAMKRPAAQATLRMQAVSPGEAPAKPKGVIRLFIVVMAFTGVMAKTKPWNSLGSWKLTSLTRAESDAPAGAAPAAPEAASKPTEAEALRKLPIVDAGGKAVALFRSERGNWYGVNAAGELSQMTADAASAQLSLPRLQGTGFKSVARHGGRIWAMDVDTGILANLLPLRSHIASEVETVILEGGEVKLRTHSGLIAELGTEGFGPKQERLSAVLADLEARKKHASSVDLRYADTAVVRLAAR